MTFVRGISLILILFLFGCSPKIKTEYIPVRVYDKLERPERPIRDKNERLSIYLTRVLDYTKKLEVIIDNYNKLGE